MSHATASPAPPLPPAPARTLPRGLVWLRRDLRADDHAALSWALRCCRQVFVAFIFDRAVLAALPRADRRVEFVRDSLLELDERLRALAGRVGAGLIVRCGDVLPTLPQLARQLDVQAVFAGDDDEPEGHARDARVRGALAGLGIELRLTKDHRLLAAHELLTPAGTAYDSFAAYHAAWLAALTPERLRPWPVIAHADALAERPPAMRQPVPTLAELGFEPTNLSTLEIEPGSSGGQRAWQAFAARLDDYARLRDFPALRGPSYLGVHLRHGTLSVRAVAGAALARASEPRAPDGGAGARAWLRALALREFFAQLLAHHPRLAEQPFRPAFARIRWRYGQAANARFHAWAEGRTGYPLVDAAMAQLNRTGYMHHRLRLVAASFLVKQLGVQWRRGERHFAERLIDHELASNNGNWQWVAGCGAEAQPWYQILNPVRQSERVDAEGRFIRHQLHSLAGLPAPAIHAPWQAHAIELAAAGLRLGHDYPLPIVALDVARAEALARYAVVDPASGHRRPSAAASDAAAPGPQR